VVPVRDLIVLKPRRFEQPGGPCLLQPKSLFASINAIEYVLTFMLPRARLSCVNRAASSHVSELPDVVN